MPLEEHEKWMRMALELARQAGDAGEVPVGAVVVKDGKMVAAARNERQALSDPTAHAELSALRAAGQAIGRWVLEGCTLYVTLEPCPMCAGAIVQARLKEVVFGAFDAQMGGMGSVYAMHLDPHLRANTSVIGGVLGAQCEQILQNFFKNRRN